MKSAPVLVILYVALATLCPAQSLPETASPPRVQVRLSLPKPTYKVGEPLEVTALIQNVGTEPFYVWQGIGFAYYGEGILTPHLTDSMGKDVPEVFKVGGHRGEGKSHFAEYVEQQWLCLAPGQFYGIAEDRFSNLLQPGRYSLVVEYSSSAFPWMLAGETINDVQESARKLKHAAVLGNFLSNEVTFAVVK
jgi:hypothetical protein